MHISKSESVSVLNEFLNKNDLDDFNVDDFEEKDRLIEKNSMKNCFFTSIDIKLDRDNTFILFYSHGSEKKKLEAYLKKQKKEINTQCQNNSDIYIVEVFFDIRSSYTTTKDYINKERKYLKSFLESEIFDTSKKIFLSNIDYSKVVINDDPQKFSASIRIDSRVRSLEKELVIENGIKNSDVQTKLKSYVFSANAKDIVENLYSNLGDDLFQNNVRFNIGNQLNVDISIRNTFKKEPDKFWFLNNGISLYVPEDSQINLNKFNEIKISVNDFKHHVSVINGAQTITAMAQELFNDSDGDLSNDDVYVLLRIYTFKNIKLGKKIPLKSAEKNELNRQKKIILDRITVSLNRQKPIKIEDIGFTSDFVKFFNEQPNLEDNLFSFSFVRRGEESSLLNRQYHLSDFARIAEAVVCSDPGRARSAGANTLLKFKKSDNDAETILTDFNHEEIFIKQQKISEIIENDGTFEDYEEIFDSKYKAINFSFCLESLLSNTNFLNKISNEASSKMENKNGIQALKKYGKYFLISCYTKKLNNFSDSYENFKYYTISNSNPDNLEGILSKDTVETELISLFGKFQDFLDRTGKGKNTNLDSNMFKENKLYNDFISKISNE